MTFFCLLKAVHYDRINKVTVRQARLVGTKMGDRVLVCSNQLPGPTWTLDSSSAGREMNTGEGRWRRCFAGKVTVGHA